MVGGKTTTPECLYWEQANKESWEVVQIYKVIKNTPTDCLLHLMGVCKVIIMTLRDNNTLGRTTLKQLDLKLPDRCCCAEESKVT